MLPKGIYAAVAVPTHTEHGVLGCQFGKSQNGNPQVAVLCEILRGPQAGQRITWFGSFTDTVQKSGGTVADRTLESLRIFGFQGTDLDTFADQQPDNEVSITVDHETYDGKTRAKVQWVNDPNRGITLANPLQGGDLRKFGAQFKSKLKGMPAVAGKKAVREAPTAASGVEDGGSGWSGNDTPDPPKANDYDQSPPAGSTDDIPF